MIVEGDYSEESGAKLTTALLNAPEHFTLPVRDIRFLLGREMRLLGLLQNRLMLGFGFLLFVYLADPDRFIQDLSGSGFGSCEDLALADVGLCTGLINVGIVLLFVPYSRR